MSYCVNCGVELDSGEKKCPLCGTPVVNPNHPCDPNAVSAYPRRVQEAAPSLVSRRMTAAIISAALVLPASICLVCNYLITGAVSWSVYILLALAVVWVASVPPLLIHRGTLFWAIGLDVAAIGGLLYVINRLTYPMTGINWFNTLALPLLLLGAAMVLFVSAAFRYRQPGKLYGFVVCLLAIGVLLVGVELITNAYLGKALSPRWSLPILILCTVIALIFIVIARKIKLRNNIKKRLHM